MEIENENALTGSVVRALREKLDMNQGEFWRSVAASGPSGCRYESGEDIPRAIRRLIYLTYIAHLPTDTSTTEDAQLAKHAGTLFHIDLAGGRKNIAQLVSDTTAQLRKLGAALNL